MRKILILVSLVFLISMVSATSQVAYEAYDLTDIRTDNFQGDIIIISAIDYYSWGYHLGYLNPDGFADKSKKVTGKIGIKFIPIKADGSYCKTSHPCSWEAHEVTIDTDTSAMKVYIPAGDVYNTDIYFYIADR